jgi:hypothetical protein
MLELGQRPSERDVWLWVPSGTSYNQASLWSAPLTLSHWRECNELQWLSCLPAQGLPHWGLQLITGTADFIRHFPHMSAVGACQHPQQGPLLSGVWWRGRRKRRWWGDWLRPDAIRYRPALA